MIEDLLKNPTSWEKLASCGEPVVIYGTGNGADMVIDELNRLGVPVAGVFASDGFVRDRVFRGFRVRHLSDFEEEFGTFTVAVAFASERAEVLENISRIALKHRVIVPCVPVYGKDIFNRSIAVSHASEIDAAYELMADEKSRRVFRGAVEFMLGGELDVLESITTPVGEAFDEILKPGADEDYLDLGAYRGDTVDEFLEHTGGKYNTITAVEPDGKSYGKLCQHTEKLDRTRCVNACVGDFSGVTGFSAGGGRQSVVSKDGADVRCVTVDELASDCRVSYLKADIEGNEMAMLAGARTTLRNCKPKLKISCYHRSEDIFALPLEIRRINPEYRIHLRKHPYIPCWELNLYCV